MWVDKDYDQTQCQLGLGEKPIDYYSNKFLMWIHEWLDLDPTQFQLGVGEKPNDDLDLASQYNFFII